MKTSMTVFLSGVMFLNVAGAVTPITDSLESAGLFKNGMALLTRIYELPGAGKFTAAPIRSAIHGTLWIESEARVLACLESVYVDQETSDEFPAATIGALQGKRVRLHLREAGEDYLEGRLGGMPEHAGASGSLVSSSCPMYGIVLDDGRQHFVAVDRVLGVESLEPIVSEGARGQRKEDVLVFEVAEASGPVQVRVSYLTRGLSWAPSYRLRLIDGGTVLVEQSATIRNETDGFEGAELSLISGFPSVEFQQVTSPFTPGMRWDTFFGQLTSRFAPTFGLATQTILGNNIDVVEPAHQAAAPLPDLPEERRAEDLYYHPVGRHSLNSGDAALFEVASAEAACERVVEWNVPENVAAGQNSEADVWDGIRFRNPFNFPMTTGPAMIMDGERFLGSRLSPWVNPGEETLVRIGRSLSIGVGASEEELGRVESTQLGRQYWESTVKGALQVTNRRPDAAELVVRKNVIGTLLQVDGDPERSLGNDGPGQLNTSTQLTWRITLAPGEQREITYRYAYLSR